MPPTRLVRTDTIANIIDFGAVAATSSSDSSVAPTNAQAFRDALASGARKIAIPAGIFPFAEIMYDGDPWLPPGVEIFGQGVQPTSSSTVTGTILRYFPTQSPPVTGVPAFQFYPGGNGAHSTIRDLTLYGPVVPDINTPPEETGISLTGSRQNRVRDVMLWYFEVGIQLNVGDTSPPSFSAYNIIERFEINVCRTGIQARNGSNGNVIRDGRIFYSLVQYDSSDPGGAREEGVGIDVEGTHASVPLGGLGLVISGVDIENAATCLRVVDGQDIAVSGGFIEPGNLVTSAGSPPVSYPYGEVRRRCLEVNEATERLAVVGTHFSEPSVPPNEWNWTPTYAAIPPEVRGIVDVDSVPGTGTAYDITGYGGGLSGTTAAHTCKLKNPDFSRGDLFWESFGLISVSPVTSAYVTGQASLSLTVDAATDEYIYQDFVVDSGVRTVTVNVRYQLVTANVDHAFRIDLLDPDANERLGFFSDTGPGPTGWRVRSLTGRFDGLQGGVVGPRTLRVRVYPYDGDVNAIDDQEVYVDSVWLVEGEYAASYRTYGEAVEMLAGDDRETFFSGSTTTNVGPVSAMPTDVPSNAIGMVVEMRVEGSRATTHGGTLSVDDQQGSTSTTTIEATLDGRVTAAEFTIPLTRAVSPALPPLWSVVVNDASNTVDYSVRLKKWILRP